MHISFLEKMGLEKKSIQEIQFTPPLIQAYIGDAVYEVFVRTFVMNKYKGSVNELHKISTQFVKASAQAKIVHALEGEWTEEEWTIIKRGRNQKSGSVPKNANLVEYRVATGFEMLVGNLYLLEKMDRLEEILQKAITIIADEILTDK